MYLNDFLFWLIGGGGSVMASSWLLERIDWFQNLKPKHKELVWYFVSSVLGIGSWYLLKYQPLFLQQIDDIFIILGGIFYSIFLGKKFNEADTEVK